jgi:hypothetical protein
MARTGEPRTGQPGPARKAVRSDGSVLYARYSKKLTRQICRRIAEGESWFQICNTDGLPSYNTLYRWKAKHPDFAAEYAQAREMAADLRADKVLAVAEASTAATVSADRLHVGALQWHAGRSAPKRWGAKAGEEAGETAAQRVIIEVRHFEVAYREDGSAYTREILPDGEGPNGEGGAP